MDDVRRFFSDRLAEVGEMAGKMRSERRFSEAQNATPIADELHAGICTRPRIKARHQTFQCHRGILAGLVDR